VLWHSRGFPIRFVSFLVSSVCLLVRVTVVDKNKAVVSCLLATSAIMLSEKKKRKRKMCSKKWYFKRNISCDVHLLNELSALRWWCGQVNWGNCGIPWVNCAVLCVWKTTGKDSSDACAIACKNCAVYSVFPSGMTSQSKIAQFNWQCIAPFIFPLQPMWNSQHISQWLHWISQLCKNRKHGMCGGMCIL